MRRGTSLDRGGAQAAKLALARLCERALGVPELGHALRPRLQRLLDFDGYCLNTCDVESGVITRSVGDGLSPEDARTLFALEAAERDVNCLSDLRRGPTRIASLWLSTAGQPEQCERMRRIFKPLGYTDELRAALCADGFCYGYLHLFRGPERAPFSLAELKRVATASPLIARALRRASASAQLARSRVPPAEPALILLDGEDTVVRRSRYADAVLENRDALRVGSGLAHVFRDLASRARLGRTARATIRRENAAPLRVSALALGAETAIVIDESSAHETEAASLAAFALTPREREVCRAVAAGSSNQSIANELGLSLHTVKDHVKSVLAKCSCATRAELAARFRGA